MHYKVSYTNPQQHYISFECTIGKVKGDALLIQLPSWRPGRYELGNFAKNVRGFRVSDEKGNALQHTKITKDCWSVSCKGVSTVRVCYEYFATDLNAGSTYLDEFQLYMNPVNCCVYVPERMGEEHVLEFVLPEDYEIACALTKKDKRTLVAPDFDRLADSPLICSATLKHQWFVLDGVEFHLWFQGECKPDWGKLIADFFIFVNEQMMLFRSSCPTHAYHFFFQVVPFRFYHGVEHVDSTVIALGPGYKLMTDVYHDLLGVSSHELFHAWNIKSIRPAEMLPYDFTKENYSRSGYVCEGVTTYYGDLMLLRSTVFSEEEYWPTFEERLQKHYDNPGRYNLSVADSSFDTWLDGYVPGAPGRKTSIYDEGCLLAFITDIRIRRATNNDSSLDDVMRLLYEDFAKKGKGYTEADYKALLEKVSGTDFTDLFDSYINAASDYTPALEDALAYIGHKLVMRPSSKLQEHYFGFKVAEPGGITRVTAVYPGSPAEKAGLALNDDILGVNGMPVKADLAEWLRYFGKRPAELVISSAGKVQVLKLEIAEKTFYPVCKVEKADQMSVVQTDSWQNWCGKRTVSSF
ncbi:MAG: peptidase M61 domain-containing protein [Bacteroidetes bacterium]|nr:MAG: peptidase M61 domain-containing protein [Bacteroidota bacterium]